MSEVCEHVSRLFRQYTGTMHFLAVLKSGHVPPDHYHMIFLLCGSFICIQLIYPFECLVTFRTGKWLLSWVEPIKCLQITALLECIVTFGAGKCLLSHLGEHSDLAEVCSTCRKKEDRVLVCCCCNAMHADGTAQISRCRYPFSILCDAFFYVIKRGFWPFNP